MRLRGEGGQSLVEFALVLPVLVLLLCGIIDFGWILSNQITLNNVSREAARYSAAHVLDDGVADDANDRDQAIAHDDAPSSLSPTVGLAYSGSSPNQSVTVTVTADVAVLTGLTSVFTGPTVTLTSSTTMMLEGQTS